MKDKCMEPKFKAPEFQRDPYKDWGGLGRLGSVDKLEYQPG